MAKGARGRDPRHFQIGALTALLLYGLWGLGFDQTPGRAVLILATALLVQLGLGRLVGSSFEPKSALVSGLSLCLLLRAASPALLVLASVLSIASKFALRVRGKHVFNPTNFGLVATALATGAAWISPGQWGTSAWLAFLLACGGGLVVHRAWRSDVTLAFLLAYAGLLFVRAALLGDPLAIPLHQLQSGSLLLFAFFMISDPKTTPDARSGRVLFGALVAAGACYAQFALYRPGGALLALFCLSPLVPLIDRVLPGPRYAWPAASVSKGVAHASLSTKPAVRLAPAPALRPLQPRLLRLLRGQGRQPPVQPGVPGRVRALRGAYGHDHGQRL